MSEFGFRTFVSDFCYSVYFYYFLGIIRRRGRSSACLVGHLVDDLVRNVSDLAGAELEGLVQQDHRDGELHHG